MNEQRYFECSGCGQLVQGWNAANGPYGVQCCENPDYREVERDLVHPDDGCTCGERRVYELVWCGPDGSPFVECQSCGREFIPGEVAR